MRRRRSGGALRTSPSGSSRPLRRAVAGLGLALVLVAALWLFLDGSEFEAAARDAVRSDETVRGQIGELLELSQKTWGGEQFDFVGSEWSASYRFRAIGTRGEADVSIELEGVGARWTSYRGRLISADGRAHPMRGNR